MPKRQTRVTGSTIPDQWPEISGKKVNIVLKSGSVLMADLLAINNSWLTIKNMRLKTQVIDVNEIAEIILDY